MTPEAMKAAAVTAPMSPGALGIIIRKFTQFYLAEYGCVGFGPHCFRHIVATEWVKNHPDGYEVAAAILHDTPETVRKAYSWVTPADKIAHWNNYFESLSGLYREGSL
jgi:integrase